MPSTTPTPVATPPWISVMSDPVAGETRLLLGYSADDRPVNTFHLPPTPASEAYTLRKSLDRFVVSAVGEGPCPPLAPDRTPKSRRRPRKAGRCGPAVDHSRLEGGRTETTLRGGGHGDGSDRSRQHGSRRTPRGPRAE